MSARGSREPARVQPRQSLMAPFAAWTASGGKCSRSVPDTYSAIRLVISKIALLAPCRVGSCLLFILLYLLQTQVLSWTCQGRWAPVKSAQGFAHWREFGGSSLAGS